MNLCYYMMGYPHVITCFCHINTQQRCRNIYLLYYNMLNPPPTNGLTNDESHSESFLIASLNSARESISALDKANKDLIGALEDSQKEIGRLSTEGKNLQTRYRQQTERLYRAEQLSTSLQSALDDCKGNQHNANVYRETEKIKMMEASMEELRNALVKSQTLVSIQSEKLAFTEKVIILCLSNPNPKLSSLTLAITFVIQDRAQQVMQGEDAGSLRNKLNQLQSHSDSRIAELRRSLDDSIATNTLLKKEQEAG